MQTLGVPCSVLRLHSVYDRPSAQEAVPLAKRSTREPLARQHVRLTRLGPVPPFRSLEGFPRRLPPSIPPVPTRSTVSLARADAGPSTIHTRACSLSFEMWYALHLSHLPYTPSYACLTCAGLERATPAHYGVPRPITTFLRVLAHETRLALLFLFLTGLRTELPQLAR